MRLLEIHHWAHNVHVPQTQKVMDGLLDDALNKVTIGVLKDLKHGEEVRLNEAYTLYYYTEDDFIAVIRVRDREEVFSVQYGRKSSKINFEEL